MRRTFYYLGLILLLASALLLGAGKFMPRLDAARWANATETTGQIVGFSGSGSFRKPLVCFVAPNGEPYVFEADAFNAAMQQGQIVTVRFFLTPELQASLILDFTAAQLWLGITGCTLAAAGLALLLLQWRKSSLLRQLMQYGTRLNATVTSIDTNRYIRINRRHPFTVTCTLRSPQGIGEMTVKSGWVCKLPPHLQIGGTVPVLVDINRPGQYWVLVEEAAAVPLSTEAAP
jgi:hypothetical protein